MVRKCDIASDVSSSLSHRNDVIYGLPPCTLDYSLVDFAATDGAHPVRSFSDFEHGDAWLISDPIPLSAFLMP
jgi:hypothetical protein